MHTCGGLGEGPLSANSSPVGTEDMPGAVPTAVGSGSIIMGGVCSWVLGMLRPCDTGDMAAAAICACYSAFTIAEPR